MLTACHLFLSWALRIQTTPTHLTYVIFKTMIITIKYDHCLPEQCKDVSRTGWIFATSKPGTKLANRLQEVDVIATNKILCQVDNSGHEWLFTVMVWWVFSNWTSQLSHFNFTFVITLQTSEKHLQDYGTHQLEDLGKSANYVFNLEQQKYNRKFFVNMAQFKNRMNQQIKFDDW